MEIDISRLVELWQKHENQVVRNLALRALTKQAFSPRENGYFDLCLTNAEFDTLWKDIYLTSLDILSKMAILIIAYYRRTLPDSEIVARAQQLINRTGHFERLMIKELLESLGESITEINEFNKEGGGI
jgi:hypothetical protein